MKYDPQIHHRRSIRLMRYDYTQPGAYFITIVTRNRESLFGEIVNGEMVLSDYGKIADECWCAIPDHFPNVELGTHVVMPNHVHGNIMIHESPAGVVGAQRAALLQPRQPNVQPGSLGAIIRSYISAVTKRINEIDRSPGAVVWQRNYYEHIIRDNHGLNRIQAYIESNPAAWETDSVNPTRINP